MLPVKHSINLYLPRFRPPQLSPEILLLIKSCLITLIGLVAVAIALLAFQFYSTGQIAELERERKILDLELATLIAKFPNTSINKNLQASLEREKKLLAKQKRVISFLRQDSISARSSFTPLIEQLSQQDVSGIWLSEIEILGQGKDIQLSGFAKTPEKVSRYITSLGSKDAYRGRSFRQINIVQGDTPWNEFFLSTQKQSLNKSSQLQLPALEKEL
ncbi:MAG: Tfp pilus assembly protein PilN [Oleispira sp.]|jgi:Tfp pilus assembly protein PilN